MLVCAAFSGGAGASDAGALLEAARRGDTAQVASLLERKVEVDAPSADGSTPLLLATANDHLAVARQLIEAGADVNRQNSRLDSPYLLAGAEGLHRDERTQQCDGEQVDDARRRRRLEPAGRDEVADGLQREAEQGCREHRGPQGHLPFSGS